MKFLQHSLFIGCLALVFIPLGCSGGPQSASVGDHIDDSGITARVKTKLLRDPSISGLDIHVRTFKGRVQLNGFVDSADQIDKAGQLAREVAGVESVENNLTLK